MDDSLKHKELTFELQEDQADSIIRQVIRWHLDVMIDDLERRKRDTGMAIFNRDKEEDIKEIKRYVKAFKLVLKYWGEKE